MRLRLAALALALLALPGLGSAQRLPSPSPEDPRLQTVTFEAGQPVKLVALPSSELTVMLLPGDKIEKVTLSDPEAFQVKVTGPADGLNIAPLHPAATALISVDTNARQYQFALSTGESLLSAYLVRFVAAPASPIVAASSPLPSPTNGSYHLTGEAALLPAKIGDDGARTYIEWDRYQSLPAVFGIGANGAEEAVDGYMRQGIFTIDRVYQQLIFRIDKKRGLARRTHGLGAG